MFNFGRVLVVFLLLYLVPLNMSTFTCGKQKFLTAEEVAAIFESRKSVDPLSDYSMYVAVTKVFRAASGRAVMSILMILMMKPSSRVVYQQKC